MKTNKHFDLIGDIHGHHDKLVALLDRLGYPADAPPVFFGHYWMPPNAPKAPPAGNIVVLDFSAAKAGNPLYAYRWNGAGKPNPEHFVTYEMAA